MRFEKFSFGSIRIDGVTYEKDVVIDRGKVRLRKKKPSRNSAIHLDIRPSRSRKGTLEMPQACDRHWNGRNAGDERSEARSQAPENQTADVSNIPGDQGFERER